MAHRICARSNKVFCRSKVTDAVRYSLLASATSRLSRTATTSPWATVSPNRLRICVTVPTTLAGTRATRAASRVIVPGTLRTRARAPFSTGATSISCASIRSGGMLIKPAGALSSPLLSESMDAPFAGLGLAVAEVLFAISGTPFEANTVRAVGDICDTRPPSAAPTARVATSAKIRFIRDISCSVVLQLRFGRTAPAVTRPLRSIQVSYASGRVAPRSGRHHLCGDHSDQARGGLRRGDGSRDASELTPVK